MRCNRERKRRRGGVEEWRSGEEWRGEGKKRGGGEEEGKRGGGSAEGRITLTGLKHGGDEEEV